MATNKNAQLRYQILDRCFRNFHHKYTIDELIDKVNDRLEDLYGTEVGVRQIREETLGGNTQHNEINHNNGTR